MDGICICTRTLKSPEFKSIRVHEMVDALTMAGPQVIALVYFVESRRRYIMSRSSRGRVRNGVDIVVRGWQDW